MSDAPALSLALLDRFRAALAIAGAPLAGQIGPGMTNVEVDELVGELGVQAPPRLRTRWTWGAVNQNPARPDAWDIHLEYMLWPPAEAVRETKLHREDPTVSRSAVAFAGNDHGYLLIERDASALKSPVTRKPIDEPNEFCAGPSLGALFALRTTQLEPAITATSTECGTSPTSPPSSAAPTADGWRESDH